MVGQLVLALQHGGILRGARDIEHRVDDQGTVVVDWIEGPGADEVAAELAACSAAGLLDLDAIAPTTSNTWRADLLISGLPVTLSAYEPLGMHRARHLPRPPRRTQPPWTWPATPLRDDGAARDTVLWTLDHDQDVTAVVIRRPLDTATGRPDTDTVIALPAENTPTDLSATRRREIDAVRRICSILLRPAAADLTVAEADQWMDTELNNPDAERTDVAVVWPDRCVLRRWSGLRIEATHHANTRRVPWSHVPSVLLSSLWHVTPHRPQPPSTLKVRAFGHSDPVATIEVSSTWGAPSTYYVHSPTGHR